MGFRIVRCAAVAALTLGSAASLSWAAGTAASGDLFFTTFRVAANPLTGSKGQDATVGTVHYSWDGSNLTLSGQKTIFDACATGDADGLIFLPNGNLAIGGAGSGFIAQITTKGAKVGSIGVDESQPNHLTLSPDGKTIYSGGSEGSFLGQTVGDNVGPLGVSSVFSTGTSVHISGSDTGITQVAFDKSGQAWYSSSPGTPFGPGGKAGIGDFGIINLTTGVTTAKLTGVNAHGITFDSFSGKLFMGGGSTLIEVDPANPTTVLGSLDLSNLGVTQIDQVVTDGKGHLLAGDNGNTLTGVKGKLILVDYSKSGVLNDSDPVAAPSFTLALDDLAPLSGAGSAPPSNNGGGGPPTVPLPAAAWTGLATIGALLLSSRVRRHLAIA